MNIRQKNKLLRILNDEIVGCYNCQPRDDGDYVWIGPSCYIDDILADYELTDDDWKYLLEEFNCPNCRTDLNSKYDEVEIKSEVDNQIDKILERISDKRTINSLKKFNDFLSKFPYLGFKNSLGRKLFKSINDGATKNVSSENWYRARLLNEESRIYKTEEMGATDPLKVKITEGRFNHYGQSFLYLSSSKETALKEISRSDNSVCVIQKFKVNNIPLILDLRSDYQNINPNLNILFIAIIYNGFIYNKPDELSSWKPEYFVPRYIADVARFLGFNGIVYSSVMGYGDNLVIFNPEKDYFTPLEEPFIYTLPPETESVTDLNIFKDL